MQGQLQVTLRLLLPLNFQSPELSRMFHASAGRAGVLILADIGFGSRSAESCSPLAVALLILIIHWLGRIGSASEFSEALLAEYLIALIQNISAMQRFSEFKYVDSGLIRLLYLQSREDLKSFLQSKKT